MKEYTHQQVHDDDTHDDQEDDKDDVGRCRVQDVHTAIVEDAVKLKFPDHHHKCFDERLADRVKRCLVLKE